MRKILLIRTDRIGDTLLTLPVVKPIKEKWPDCQIDFLARKYTHPILKNVKEISQILNYDHEGAHRGIRGHQRLANEIQQQEYDSAILFYPRFGLTFALWRADVPRRIGTSHRWYSFLLTDRVHQSRRECLKHEVEYNLDLLEPIIQDVKSEIPQFRLAIPEKTKLEVQGKLNANDILEKYFVVHPGNGDSAPNLSWDQYRQLIQQVSLSGIRVVLTGVDLEKEYNESLKSEFSTNNIIDLTGTLSLEQMIALLSEACGLITTSTGPAHIASAVGTPVTTFFCPAIPHTPDRWGPLENLERVTTPKLTNSHCKMKQCPHGTHGCLATCLQDDEISQALNYLL
ncbi:MAG: glycosyltransferase family 9 protein [SAR324 cluster bacterium]|nr:glycosyltransferase family 9 protein [SAR324 cluster bacterium]